MHLLSRTSVETELVSPTSGDRNYMDDWWIVTEDTPEGVALQRKIAHEFLD